uniref:6-phosphogluconate dehydrogenase, decarboxylating n=1 Tax=Eptatretus burgeri TaxID=7764 RepID=A0A8C4QRF1_EPTBU
MAEADVALIGLAVMGQNLVLNMNDHGFVVCVYNRTVSKVDEFLQNEAKGTNVIGAHSLKEMVAKLKEPRRVILLVKAGQAVDDFITKLVPLLEKGDIIIDGGNSEYRDTNRRCTELKAKGLLFVGSGVSGGEEGARYGPSLMPGGEKDAWPHIKNIFQSIAATVETGESCCDWVGGEGSGHFVKMVHNGIEYGDMQLIAEAYHLMNDVLVMDHDQMAKVFEEWNKTELDSFLIEITAHILAYKDSDGTPLVPKILDSAGQKGTGKWTAIAALEYGMPVTLIVYSLVKSRKPLTETQIWTTFYWIIFSSRLSKAVRCPGAVSSHPPFNLVYLYLVSALHWLSMMDIVMPRCLQISYRLREITLVLTRMNCCLTLACSCTPTGQVMVEPSPALPTMHKSCPVPKF